MLGTFLPPVALYQPEKTWKSNTCKCRVEWVVMLLFFGDAENFMSDPKLHDWLVVFGSTRNVELAAINI